MAVEPFDFDGVELDDDVAPSDELDEVVDDESLDVELDDPESEAESLDEVVVVDVVPRLSFLKNPLPLNVTPTG